MNCNINFDFLYYDGSSFTKKDIPGYFVDVFHNWRKVSLIQSKEFLESFEGISFTIPVSHETTFYTVVDYILNTLEIDKRDFYMCVSPLFAEIRGELVNISNYGLKICEFMELYSYPETLQLYFLFSHSQGEIERRKGISYCMHSNEQGHNSPHVHVRAGNKYNASIDIISLEIIAGSLPKRYQREILSYIRDNQDKLIDYWNKNTNGLHVNIDYSLLHSKKS